MQYNKHRPMVYNKSRKTELKILITIVITIINIIIIVIIMIIILIILILIIQYLYFLFVTIIFCILAIQMISMHVLAAKFVSEGVKFVIMNVYTLCLSNSVNYTDE